MLVFRLVCAKKQKHESVRRKINVAALLTRNILLSLMHVSTSDNGPKMKRKDWTPEKVKQALRDAGTTTCALAKKYGVSRQAMSITLRRSNTRGEARIADALGLHPMDIWPSRYDVAGASVSTPFELKPVPALKFSARESSRNGKEIAVITNVEPGV